MVNNVYSSYLMLAVAYAQNCNTAVALHYNYQ